MSSTKTLVIRPKTGSSYRISLVSRLWKVKHSKSGSCYRFLVLLAASAMFAADYKPAPENLTAREWFQDAKFGLFIHWGVYSVLGKGEWVMNNDHMSVAEYEKLPSRFNPTAFDAAEWVSMAKNAGMKYITITSKHHDGFAMFASNQSDWNIVNRTLYQKDPLKMLADECHRQGIKLFFYHSQLDWHNPDYYPLGRTGHDSGRPPGGDFNRYLDYMDGQLRELLTNYGEIGGIWFDGMWDKPDADWRLNKTYSLIHSLQPAALVGSNHHLKPFDGEDFQMFEKDLPGGRTADFNEKSEIGSLPLESCDTINGAWGYNRNDKRFKSTKQLIQYLVRAAGNNANFLLNVGPMPNGAIQPEFVERLHEMGGWLRANGDSIYHTRGGPITPRPWGVTTQSGSKIYVHVLDWNDEVLALPKLPKIRKATLLASGKVVEVKEIPGGTLLRFPMTDRDPVDTIVVLERAQ
jgi:alpha-L-fucosidase